MVSKRAEISGQDKNGRYVINFTFPEKAEKFDLKKEKCNPKYLAYNAKSSADEYFSLIKKNFKFKDIDISRPKFEIFVSLCGLTCELYLKSFIYYLQPNENATYVKGHKIYSELYSKLSQPLKEKIKNALIKEFPDKDFDIEFNKLDSVFEDYRYSYELNGFSLNTAFLIKLLQELKNIKLNEII